MNNILVRFFQFFFLFSMKFVSRAFKFIPDFNTIFSLLGLFRFNGRIFKWNYRAAAVAAPRKSWMKVSHSFFFSFFFWILRNFFFFILFHFALRRYFPFEFIFSCQKRIPWGIWKLTFLLRLGTINICWPTQIIIVHLFESKKPEQKFCFSIFMSSIIIKICSWKLTTKERDDEIYIFLYCFFRSINAHCYKAKQIKKKMRKNNIHIKSNKIFPLDSRFTEAHTLLVYRNSFSFSVTLF